MIRSRRRGEGYVEYVVILSLIMVCSVVGLLRAGSGAIDRMAQSRALCTTCPAAKLQGDDIEKYNLLMERRRSGGLSALEEDSFSSLASKRREDLEVKRSVVGLSEDEAAELEELNSYLPERADAIDEVDDATPVERPGLLGLFDSLFGVGWEDTWIVDLMSIFGWFSFFTV